MSNSIEKLEDILEGFDLGSKTIIPKTRIEIFKSNNSELSQQKRRNELIKKQKENREKAIQELRNRLRNKNVNDEIVSMSEETDEVEELEEMEIDSTKLDKRETYLRRKYRDILMMPELLDEIPEDFIKSWSAVPYPSGLRCVVISGNGKTDSRSESGVKIVETFDSLLPGGSYRNRMASRSILDCIYVESESTFYVLDLIMWKGFDFIDCECECRFFMRNSRIEEISNIDKIRSGNDYIFKPLKYYRCNKEGLKKAKEENPSLEGILFYHNDAIYVSERNPLMCGLSKDNIDSLINSLEQ